MREGLSFGQGREMHEKRRPPSDGDTVEEAHVYDRAALARMAREAISEGDVPEFPRREPKEPRTPSGLEDAFPKRRED